MWKKKITLHKSEHKINQHKYESEESGLLRLNDKIQL